MNEQTGNAWAGMLTSWNYGIYGSREIAICWSPQEYVVEMATRLSNAVAMLVEHYAEEVNCAELESLHESWFDEPYPEEGWCWEDVLNLLKTLPAQAIAEYERTSNPEVLKSCWYNKSLGFLNDIFPYGSGVWVNFEGVPSIFLAKLLNFEAKAYHSIEDLTDAGAEWLGKAFLLSQLNWDEQTPVEQRRALYTLLDAFNEDNAEIGAL